MFRPRRIESSPDSLDADGVKLYRVSASGENVSSAAFIPRLREVKKQKSRDWHITPSFAIFH